MANEVVEKEQHYITYKYSPKALKKVSFTFILSSIPTHWHCLDVGSSYHRTVWSKRWFVWVSVTVAQRLLLSYVIVIVDLDHPSPRYHNRYEADF